MPETAIILLAHGAREPEWATPLRRVFESVAAQAPDLRVEFAFIELMSPDLRTCAEKLIAEGVRSIRIVPLLIARGGHLTHGAPKLIDALHQEHPQVSFELMGPVGEADAVVQAMAAHVLDMARQENRSSEQ